MRTARFEAFSDARLAACTVVAVMWLVPDCRVERFVGSRGEGLAP